MAKGKFTTQVNPGSLEYAICYRDAMGRYRCLACCVSLKLASAMASVMASDLDSAYVDGGKARAVLYVMNVKGIIYASY